MLWKTRTVKHRRSYRPSFDQCEDRVVMTLPSLGKFATTLVGSLGQTLLDQGTGAVFGAVLGAIGLDSGNNQAEFDKINQKLDAVQADITALKQEVSVLTQYTQYNTLSSIVDSLNIPAIDNLWDKFVALEQLSASNRLRPAGAPLPTKADADLLAQSIVKDLEHTVTKFYAAFLGKHEGAVSPAVQIPLMTVISDILKKNVTTTATGTTASAPFLTSNYSTEMAAAYNYFADEEAKAVFLLVNAYKYLHAPGQAYTVEASFPTDHPAVGTAEQKDAAKLRFQQQVATAPHYAIPSVMVVDTRTGLGWSQFEGLVTYAYTTKTQLLYYLRGDAAALEYVPTAAKAAAQAAHKAEVDSGLPMRLFN